MPSSNQLSNRFCIPLYALILACFPSIGFAQNCYISDGTASCKTQKYYVKVWETDVRPDGSEVGYVCRRNSHEDAICTGGTRQYDINIRSARGQQRGRSKMEPCGRWEKDYYTCDGQRYDHRVLKYEEDMPCGELQVLSGDTCVEQ